MGHAIEALKSPALMHGECVAIGCVVEAELSLRMGNSSLSREKIERVTRCFASYGLPIHVPRRADMHVPGPLYCAHGLRVPASCVLHVPEAQGSLLPGRQARYVRRARTYRGRAVRIAYRVVHHRCRAT